MAAAATPAGAGPPEPPAAESLQINPQSGATPRPLLQPIPLPVVSPVAETRQPERKLSGSLLRPIIPQLPIPVDTALTMPDRGGLPAPVADPLRIDPMSDPILQLAHKAVSLESFRQVVGAAVARSPALTETLAQAEEAQGARNEARARQYPTVNLSLSYFNVVSRAFSNDPLNILERSRPRSRTDAAASVQQPIFDFGASSSRIRAAGARLDAAVLQTQDMQSQLALRVISAWYNVFGYRALVSLTTSFAESERDLRGELEHRVTQGYSAPADVAQVDSYIAATEAQLADFRRLLANAEAQYTELVGAPPPAQILRAPEPPRAFASADAARLGARSMPAVRAARSLANAAVQDVKATKADMLPGVSVGVDAGRYGVVETKRDYDVRANATLSWRLFGGAKQRVDQAVARSHGSEARYERTVEEAERDAAIAYSDVDALEAEELALGENYLATRRSRDVIAERFRVSRGTLFDLIQAENNYFSVATRYILTLSELDAARYVLLARTGRLPEVLALQSPRLAG